MGRWGLNRKDSVAPGVPAQVPLGTLGLPGCQWGYWRAGHFRALVQALQQASPPAVCSACVRDLRVPTSGKGEGHCNGVPQTQGEVSESLIKIEILFCRGRYYEDGGEEPLIATMEGNADSSGPRHLGEAGRGPGGSRGWPQGRGSAGLGRGEGWSLQARLEPSTINSFIYNNQMRGITSTCQCKLFTH